jgi:hypothetical protein
MKGTEFEQFIEAKVKDTMASKMKIRESLVAASSDQAVQFKTQYQDLLLGETNPEVRGIYSEIVAFCAEKIETEERLDKAAVQFVETGTNLKKFARDKVLKKTKHDPVSSVVKCTSGTLLWGSHKTGPKVHHVEKGPSDMLKSSGILGPRSANIHALHDPSFVILSFCWIALTLRYSPNEKLHFHVSVSDGTSTLGGREIIDFVTRCSQPCAYPCC